MVSINNNFTDNLNIPTGKYLKWFNNSLSYNILTLNTSNNVILNSTNNGDIHINSNNESYTFFHNGNSKHTLFNTKIAVSINDTSNIASDIALPNFGFIGLNTTQGTHSGYLGLAGSSSLLNTSGSKILLYGINATGGNAGKLHLYAGNNTEGTIQLITGDNKKIFEILNSGTVNFSPDGSTITVSIEETKNIVTAPIHMLDNTNSSNYSSGALVISGGVGIRFSESATDTNNGGALSIAGGLALGKNAMIGGNITIFNSNDSTSSFSGSGIFYGGVGINGQLNISSDKSSQIVITPKNTGDETSILFNNENNYTTTGSWKIGHNSIGTDNLIIHSGSTKYIELTNNQIKFHQPVNNHNTQHFYTTQSNLITFNDTQGNSVWSIGKTSDEIFKITRFTQGNLIDNLITSDILTGNITFYNTENAVSVSNGGCISIKGGSSIQKDLYVGGNIDLTGNIIQSGPGTNSLESTLQLQSGLIQNNISLTLSGVFNASNNQLTPTNITGLLFDNSIYNSFNITLDAVLLRTSGGNYKSQYTIDGIQTDSGWGIYITNIGDEIDLIFSVVSGTGQLQYHSTNPHTNFISLTFNFSCKALYISGGFNTITLPSGISTINNLNIISTENVTNINTAPLKIYGGASIHKNLLVNLNISSSSLNTTDITTNNLTFSGTGSLKLNNTAFIFDNYKKYIYSGNISNITNGNLILNFNATNSYFHAKVSAILQENSNPQYVSTLIYELSAAGSNTTSITPQIWNVEVNGPANPYIWSNSITASSSNTTASAQFTPITPFRNYNYTILIDLIGTSTLNSLSQDNTTIKIWDY